jgi:hypothetical protein
MSNSWLVPRAVRLFIAPEDERKTMKPQSSHVMIGANWNGPFWFAVLSPVLGMLAGFLALVCFSS